MIEGVRKTTIEVAMKEGPANYFEPVAVIPCGTQIECIAE
jgi:hypothetical protein